MANYAPFHSVVTVISLRNHCQLFFHNMETQEVQIVKIHTRALCLGVDQKLNVSVKIVYQNIIIIILL